MRFTDEQIEAASLTGSEPQRLEACAVPGCGARTTRRAILDNYTTIVPLCDKHCNAEGLRGVGKSDTAKQ